MYSCVQLDSRKLFNYYQYLYNYSSCVVLSLSRSFASYKSYKPSINIILSAIMNHDQRSWYTDVYWLWINLNSIYISIEYWFVRIDYMLSRRNYVHISRSIHLTSSVITLKSILKGVSLARCLSRIVEKFSTT